MNNTTKISVLLVSAIFAMWSCADTSNKQENAATTEELSQGLALIEANCIICHSPAGKQEARIAPPLLAIKKHYMQEKTTQEEFTKALVAYVKNPSKANSKMPGALEKFGLMPKLNLNDSDLTKIATYIFQTELEAPQWFQKHYDEEHGKSTSENKNRTRLEQGQQLASQTKAVLGKNLLGAINSKGTVGAMEFCNTQAIPLTDSMSRALNASIYRLSDKARNPKNQAQEPFLSKIQEYKELLAKGEEPKGGSIENEGRNYYYYPIVTNAMCLQCHGKKDKQIPPAVLAKIKELYPKDLATGYSENELRGIWVVEMK